MRRIGLVAVLLVLVVPPVSADDALPTAKEPAGEKVVEVKRGHVPSYPRVITGRITGSDGNPVARALIEWGPKYPHDAPRETTRSAEDGTYRLEVKSALGSEKLGVSATGFCPQWCTEMAPGPRSAPTQLDFKLAPETTLDVTIVDESGAPIPGLEVTPMTPAFGFYSSFSVTQQPEPIPGHDTPTPCTTKGECRLHQLLAVPESVYARDAKPEYLARENDLGWLSLKITRHRQWVHAHQITRKEFSEGHGKIRIVVPNYRNQKIEHRGSLFGQVVDQEGKPVRDYFVTIRFRSTAIAIGDSEGCFRWGTTLDPNSHYEIRIFARGFAPQEVHMKPLETDEAKPERIVLEPHPSAEFHFVDAQTMKPLVGVSVLTGVGKAPGWNYMDWNSIHDYADGHHTLHDVLHLVSNAEGRISVPEGRELATLVILTPGYARTIVTPQSRPAPDKDGRMPIALAPAASILAVAAPDSRIARHADGIDLYPASRDPQFPGVFFQHMFHGLKLDKNRECLIDSLAAGDYHIALTHSDGSTSTSCWSKKVTLKSGERLNVSVGEMTGTMSFSGRTSPYKHLRLNRKTEEAAVGEQDEDGVDSIATLADVDGYFEFDHLQPGTYTLEMSRLSPSTGGYRDRHPKTKQIVLTKDMHLDDLTDASPFWADLKPVSNQDSE